MKVSYYIEIGNIKKKDINYKSIPCHNSELYDICSKARKVYKEWLSLSCNDYSSVDYVGFHCTANTVRGVELGRSLLEKYIKDLGCK